MLFICVSFLIISLGFGELEIFPSFDINEFLSVNKPEKSIKSNDELIEELKNEYLIKEVGNKVPDYLNAIWIDINNDIDASAEDGTDAVKYDIYSDFDYYRNFIPNALFVKPDTMNEYSSLLEPDSSKFDILAYLLYYSGTLELENILVIDDSIIFDNNGNIVTDKVAEYLNNYNFDGVLLSADSIYGNTSYVDAVNKFSTFIRTEFKDIYFGVEIHTDYEAQFADDYVISVFENKFVDFGYVDCNSVTSAEDYSFQNIALWWNSFADYYGIPFYCEHRADMIFTDDTLWGKSNEINLQLKALYNCPAFDGSCYYTVSSLKTKKALARDLSILLNDVASTSQDSFSVDDLSIKNNRITFQGSIMSDSLNLYCNDTRILTKDNKFEKSYILSLGLNDYNFFCNAGTYSYSIYNNLPLISSYYPSANVVLDSSRKISPYAVCPIDSYVFAVINGNTYQMSETAVSEITDIPEGFTVYSCDIAFSASLSSNELSILCCKDGSAESVSCCNVYTSSFQKKDSQILQKTGYSPYSDNGLGVSQMCMLKYDNTEQISEKNDYDTYHPYNSDLLNGTYDYVENINVSSEGNIRYELKSGINVYGVNAVLINNAYTLPLNKVTLTSFDDTATDKTSFSFSLNWLSPITVTTQKVDYKTGYQGYAFNIESFDAQYVDLTFYYSESITFASDIIFDSNCVFSKYELFKGTNDSMILRLYLRTPGKFYGFDLREKENGEVEVSFKKRINNSLNGKVVMLDPGHGGLSMVGTAVNDNSVSESQITLDIAFKTKSYLESMGAKVLMTRIMDTSLSLSERTYMCETQNPDIFVSIHCDGAEALTESGTHTFYFTPFSQSLASRIHNRMISAYASKIYIEADDNYSRIDRKIKFYPFYVTRVDNCPAVLIETGFLTNYVEGKVLSNPVNQDHLARAIADGISDYFLY